MRINVTITMFDGNMQSVSIAYPYKMWCRMTTMVYNTYRTLLYTWGTHNEWRQNSPYNKLLYYPIESILSYSKTNLQGPVRANIHSLYCKFLSITQHTYTQIGKCEFQILDCIIYKKELFIWYFTTPQCGLLCDVSKMDLELTIL